MTNRSRRARSWLTIALPTLVGLAIFMLVVELGSMVYVSARQNRYVPAKKLLTQTHNAFIAQLTKGGSGCRYLDTLFPHPYLAFVHHGRPPCGIPHINNIGLFGDNFPHEKRQDRFVVLLTGGSVAAQLGQIGGPGAPKFLEEALNRKYRSPNGKPFLVLNGADAAWKQPQQLILYLLYAEIVDAIVTLDGFNEHYTLESSLRFEYPSNNFTVVNPKANHSFGKVVLLWAAGRIAGFLSTNPVTQRSHASYLFVSGLEDLIQRASYQMVGPKVALGTMFALPEAWDKEKRKRNAVAQYRKYVHALNATAKRYSLPVAHFIQPVPAIRKTLTDQERAVIGDLGYGEIYQWMTDQMLELNGQGLSVHSLLGLLENERGTIYADSIHFETGEEGDSRGYRIMAQSMASTLAKSWKLPELPGSAGHRR